MKLTKEKLKQIIREEMEDIHAVLPKFSEYEMDDMSTDQQMVALLRDISDQLKVLNHHMTPAKTMATSGMEKALAGARVAEGEEK